MILKDQGARLKQARATLGMSQIAFAAMLGVQQCTVSRWEISGRVHARNLRRVQELLNARSRHLGAPPESLRFEAAILARDVLTSAEAGMLASQQLKEQARRVLDLTKRGE